MKYLLLLSALLSGCAVSQETTPAEVQLDADVVKAQASALSSAVSTAQANDADAGTAIVSGVKYAWNVSITATDVSFTSKASPAAARASTRP